MSGEQLRMWALVLLMGAATLTVARGHWFDRTQRARPFQVVFAAFFFAAALMAYTFVTSLAHLGGFLDDVTGALGSLFR